MATRSKAMDAEQQAFAADVLTSLRQAKAGQHARVTPGEVIAERVATKARGRPKLAATKPMLSMRTDQDILDHLRASGKGWQTRVNALLRDAVAKNRI